MRVVITAGVATDLRAFTVLPSRKKIKLTHGKKDAPLRRFQTVTHIRQRARNNDGHRVIKKRILDLLGDVNLLYLFVRREKRGGVSRRRLRRWWIVTVIVLRHVN